MANQNSKSGIVVLGTVKGHSVVPLQTPLNRLHYYDGKYLRARDLNREQAYFRSLGALSNIAGGMGVVHGLDCAVVEPGDLLEVGGGMAFDGRGRVILLPSPVRVGIETLLEKSGTDLSTTSSGTSPGAAARGTTFTLSDKPQFTEIGQAPFNSAGNGSFFKECELKSGTEPGDIVRGDELYIIFIGSIEAYCGEEDIYGKLCEDACITGTERPWIIEGAVIRALPLVLKSPLKTSSSVTLTDAHLRSLLASAYYRDEKNGDLVSAEGLENGAWCKGSDLPFDTEDVPIGLLARNGKTTRFFDPWIPRRERIGAPARSWWARQMAMRPWQVFLAQVLQFQCQLKDCVRGGGFVREDPCDDLRGVIRQTSVEVGEWINYYAEVTELLTRVGDNITVPKYKGGGATLETLDLRLKDAGRAPLSDRALINCGIVELPSAGYLPVVPGRVATVNEQVRAMMGDGVDLRFCVVRADYVPHALEEAQHMERICLLGGLDNPADKPRVDILVPGGSIKEMAVKPSGTGYEMLLSLNLFYGFSGGSDFSRDSGFDSVTGSAFVKKSYTSSGMYTQALEGLGTLQSMDALSRSRISFFGAARGESLPTGGAAFYYSGLEKEKKELSPAVPGYLSRADLARAKRGGISHNIKGAGRSGNISGLYGTTNRLSVNISGRAAEGERGSAATWLSISMLHDVFALGVNRSTPLSGSLMILLPAVQGRTGGQVVDLTFNGKLTVDALLPETGGNRRIKAHLSGVLVIKRMSTGGGTGRSRPIRTVVLDQLVTLEQGTGDGGLTDTLIKVANLAFLNRADLVVSRKWMDGTTAEAIGYLVTEDDDREGVARGLDVMLMKRAEPQGKSPAGVRLKESAGGIRIEREPASISSGLKRFRIDPRRVLFQAKQSIEASALIPGNRAHGASTEAIRLIGSAMAGTRFEVQATLSLFPPVEEPKSELEVLASADWVLFHRRRDKLCDVVSPLPRLQPRRYRIHGIRVKNSDELKLLVKGLEENNGPLLDRFKRLTISTVAFQAGIHAMETPPEYLLADWKMKIPAETQLAYGAIASRGEAFDEGEALGAARLSHLGDILKTANDVTADAVFQVLPQVPDLLGEGLVDGVMVFAAQMVRPVCQRVYRIAHADGVADELEKALEGVDDKLEEFLTGQFQATWLHDVGFYPDTADIHDNSIDGLEEKWKENGNGVVQEVVVISERFKETPTPTPAPSPSPTPGPSGSEPTESELLAESLLLKNQAGVIAGVLGEAPPADAIRHFRTWAEIDKCGAVAVLLARPQGILTCHEVHKYIEIIPDTFLENLRKNLGGSGGDDYLEKYFLSAGKVRFELPATPVDPTELDTVAAFFADFEDYLKNDDSLKLHVVTLIPTKSAGTTAESVPSEANLGAQATEISQKLGDNDPPEGLTWDGEDLPGDCEGVTLVILVQVTGKQMIHMPLLVADSDFVLSTRAETGFNFDKDNELVFDRQYLDAVRILKKRDIRLDLLAFAGETKPEGEAAVKRLDALYTALDREGLIKEGGTRESVALAEHDRKVLNQGSLKFDNVFIARF